MNHFACEHIMYRLADLMEEHKEELATLESLDSGAVYTLALKTHIGFSIDSLRYFAGWCDKIQVDYISITMCNTNNRVKLYQLIMQDLAGTFQ